MKGLKHILFLDIETVSAADSYDKVSERLKVQWSRKANYLKRSQDISDEELYLDRAAIYAEFGKIITIGLGYFHTTDEGVEFRTKALYGHDEVSVLNDFKEILKRTDNGNLKLCAHNGREFDFPYISRRMLINGISLPSVLDLKGKKPWEVNHLDTMDLWKFGDWKHYSSLELLASIFNIESSKSDIDGSMVNDAYYKEDKLMDIVEYCIQDVVVTAKLYLKLNSIDIEGLKIVKINHPT